MAYAVHAPELHRNAAAYVDRILKGAKVSDLPVQQPTKFDLGGSVHAEGLGPAGPRGVSMATLDALLRPR